MSVPFVLAPLAALSHRALRQLIYEFGGCDEYFSEMLSAPSLLAANPLESYYLDAGPVPEQLVYQIVGSDPEVLAQAAALLDERDCRGIDLNMGCSAPEIVRIGAGVWWMDHPDEAFALAGKLRKAIRRHRFSVKLRLGSDENLDRLVYFCRGLEREGVDLITVHPRTSKEKLKRRARWTAVEVVKEALSIPVAGNGDIEDASQLVHRARSGCDAVMVGRAAVRAPWIFAEARALEQAEHVMAEPSTAELATAEPRDIDLLAVADRFLELLELYQPPEYFESRSKKFFLYFCENLTWAHHVRTLLGRETERRGMMWVLENYFAQESQDRHVSIPSIPIIPGPSSTVP
ncbi:tRNA-dihydrouridine synthase [Gracilinema caldarium]|uniref:tRNA dihydrouridine synthase n=1 Tax=Gracilinema caldarium TaxID=215591 RepID=UPI0026EDD943|nr:tRNA-dihydrouridine synthase family protein [Gracilinema caldarium]